MSVSDPQMCRRVLWVFVGSEPLVSLLCVRRVEPVIINSSYGNADACFSVPWMQAFHLLEAAGLRLSEKKS